MIPPAFSYLAPKTLPEALSLLRQHGEAAKVLAGGHSLIPMMKLRLATPAYLIDIGGIPGLEYLREADGFLHIGAMTREVALESSDLVRDKYPILYDTARMIADPQVRNLATVGGNLAHGDPGNDHPATMLALGAEVVAEGPDGRRTIPVRDFFVDFYATALTPDEILVEIRIPTPPPGSGGAYLKLERKVGDYATAGVAAQVTLDDDGRCTYAGIGLTNVGYIPIKVTAAEAALVGGLLTDDALEEAARVAAEASQPSDDLRGSAAYKRDMVRVLTVRALRLAAERARG